MNMLSVVLPGHCHNFKYFICWKCLWRRVNWQPVRPDNGRKGQDNSKASWWLPWCKVYLHTSWVPSRGPPAAAWWHLAPCRGCWPFPVSSHSAPGYPERAWKCAGNRDKYLLPKTSASISKRHHLHWVINQCKSNQIAVIIQKRPIMHNLFDAF